MKKRVLFLLVGLNLLLISSISMSLAWFIGSARLNVDGFVITIDGDADLKISTSKDTIEGFKDSLTSEDIGEMPDLIPVTSMRSYYLSNGWIDNPATSRPTFLGQYKNGNQMIPNIEKTNRGFFSLDLYLESDKHMYVTLDSSNCVKDDQGNFTDSSPIIKSNDEKNSKKADDIAKDKATRNYKAIADKEIAAHNYTGRLADSVYSRVYAELLEKYKEEIPGNLSKIVNSVRFSILDYENLARKDENDFESNYIIIDPTKTEKSSPVVFGGRLCTSLTREYYDYYIDNETKEMKETLFGDIKHGENIEEFSYNQIEYLDAATEDIPLKYKDQEPSCFNSGTLKGVKAIDDNCLSKIPFYTEKSLSPEEADVTASGDETKGYLIELIPYTPHHLVLSVYVEGWDLDNLDSTQEGSFDLNIKFKAFKQARTKKFDQL